MGKKAYDIVMEQRTKIVEKIIKNMEEGYFFLPDKWNREALRPQNPISKVKYVGVNRFILGLEAISKGYTDPRWLTYNQAKENDLKIKEEELKNYTICEKWIWTKEVEVEDEENPGEKKKAIIELKVPQVFYFRVYNGNQIENMPELEKEKPKETEISKITESFILSSKCPVQELAEERAFYSPLEDKIVLPLRSSFINEEAFLNTLWHEMAHSTGHETRFNREILNQFGTPKYAREEITAELSAVFLEADFGLDNISNTQDHSNYFNSWITVLKNNPKELFQATNEASRIAEYLTKNYEMVLAIDKTNLKDSLYKNTQNLYKSLIGEEDIENPKSDLYKKAKEDFEKIKSECNKNGIDEKEQEEIVEQAKQDLKNEISEEIQTEEISNIQTEYSAEA